MGGSGFSVQSILTTESVSDVMMFQLCMPHNLGVTLDLLGPPVSCPVLESPDYQLNQSSFLY